MRARRSQRGLRGTERAEGPRSPPLRSAHTPEPGSNHHPLILFKEQRITLQTETDRKRERETEREGGKDV